MAEAARRALVTHIRPVLEQLSRRLDETVELSVLDHNHATFVDQVVANHRLRAVSAVGESFPLHCTANGKAFLAAMPNGAVNAALPATLPALTRHTITSPDVLRKELELVRQESVALHREEHTEGICAVGAVLQEAGGQLVAVSVPVPVQRFYGRARACHRSPVLRTRHRCR